MLVIRLPLPVSVAAGIALVGIPADLVPARMSTWHAPAMFKPLNNPTRTLQVRDSTWNQVRVEVRTGPYTSCDALGSLGTQVLQRGQEWVVQVDDPVICWRREQTPGDPASRWTPWQQLQLADGEIRVVTL